MATWQIQQAKARLSDVIEQAQVEGPQFITRHGLQRAVLISAGEYEQLSGKKKSFTDHLLSFPDVDFPEIKRDIDLERDLNL